MKAILSLNANPIIVNTNTKHNPNAFFGWRYKSLFLKCFYLSVEFAKKHFKEVQIYTDKYGFEILEPLELDVEILPYLQTNDFTSRFWAISKIDAIKLQKKPFVHIDNDFILLKELNQEYLNSDVFCACFEPFDQTGSWYPELINDFKINGKRNVLPDLDKYIYEKEILKYSFNNGIIGGNNIEFFQQFCDDIYKYLKSNPKNCNHISSCYFLEQYYIGCKAKSNNIKIKTIENELVPKSETFVHPYGWNKQLPEYINFINEKFFLFEKFFHNIIPSHIQNYILKSDEH